MLSVRNNAHKYLRNPPSWPRAYPNGLAPVMPRLITRRLGQLPLQTASWVSRAAYRGRLPFNSLRVTADTTMARKMLRNSGMKSTSALFSVWVSAYRFSDAFRSLPANRSRPGTRKRSLPPAAGLPMSDS
jgi:hypothetical protein